MATGLYTPVPNHTPVLTPPHPSDPSLGGCGRARHPGSSTETTECRWPLQVTSFAFTSFGFLIVPVVE